MSSVRCARAAGSYGCVMACRSTTENRQSCWCWSRTQFCTAPREVPMCNSPEGWMPEKTRAIGVRTYDVGVGRRKVRELKDLVDVAKAAAERAADYLRRITPAAPGQWVEKGRHDFDRCGPHSGAPDRRNAHR